jgi:hypothetical protein
MPSPVVVEATDVLEGTADQIRPGAEPSEAEADAAPDAEAAAEDEAAGEAVPGGDDPAPPPAAPVAVEVAPWPAHTVGSPLSLVNDAGETVRVLRGPPVAVVVLMEGEDRVKVRCEGCEPPAEGWLQRTAVAR